MAKKVQAKIDLGVEGLSNILKDLGALETSSKRLVDVLGNIQFVINKLNNNPSGEVSIKEAKQLINYYDKIQTQLMNLAADEPFAKGSRTLRTYTTELKTLDKQYDEQKEQLAPINDSIEENNNKLKEQIKLRDELSRAYEKKLGLSEGALGTIGSAKQVKKDTDNPEDKDTLDKYIASLRENVAIQRTTNKLLDEEYEARKKILELMEGTAKKRQALQEEGYKDKNQADKFIKSAEAIGENSKQLRTNTDEAEKNNETNVNVGKTQDKNSNAIAKATKNIITYTAIYRTLRKVLHEAIKSITEMDKAITGMTMVTAMSRKEALSYTTAIQEIAQATSMTITDVANLTTGYLRQGRAMSDALILAEQTAKSARVAGITYNEAITYMTSAINGFKLKAEDAARVSDIFANLAAKSATNFENLAIALSKVSAQANTAGLSIAYTTALLAKGIETTQEAPESIGTALKTVLARMRELSDYGSTLEDNTDINQVESALRAVGIALRDDTGQFRDMQAVFNDIGQSWDNYTSMQQQAIAQAMAGTRQQSRLLAIFQDWDRTLELVDEAQNSAGASAYQYSQYAQGMESAMNRLATSWQTFTQTLVNTNIIIDGLNFITGSLNTINGFLQAAPDLMQAIVVAVTILVGLNIIINRLHKQVLQKQLLQQLANKSTEASLLTQSIMLQVISGIKTKGLLLSVKELLAQKSITREVIKQKAISLGVAGVALGIVVAIGYGIAQIIKNRETEEKKLQRIRDLNNEIYEGTQKIASLQALIKEYKDLDGKITKTTDDLIRMKEILEEMKVLSIGQAEINLNTLTSEEKDKIRHAVTDSTFTPYEAGTTDVALNNYLNVAIDGMISEEEWKKATKQMLEGINFKDVHKTRQLYDGEELYFLDGIIEATAEAAFAFNNAEESMADTYDTYIEYAKRFKDAPILLNMLNNRYKGLANISTSNISGQNLQTFQDATGLSVDSISSLFSTLYTQSSVESIEQFVNAVNSGGDKALGSIITNLKQGKFFGSNLLPNVATKVADSLLAAMAPARSATGMTALSKTQTDRNKNDQSYLSTLAKGETLDDTALTDLFNKYPQLAVLYSSQGNQGLYMGLIDAINNNTESQLDEWDDIIKSYDIDIEAEKALNNTLTGKEKEKSDARLEQLRALQMRAQYNKDNLLSPKTLSTSDKIGVNTAKIQQLLTEAAKEGADLADIYNQISQASSNTTELLQTDLDMSIANFAKAAGLTNEEFKQIFIFSSSGIAIISEEWDKLNNTQRNTVEQFKRDVESQVKDLYKSKEDQLQTDIKFQQTAIQLMKDKLKQEYEANKANLDARKKLYEDYYDSIDKEEESNNFEKERQRLQDAISNLSTVSDAASLQKLKEYQEELGSLEKDHNKTMRDNEKEVVLQTIEDTQDTLEQTYTDAIADSQALWDNFANLGIEGMKDLFTAFSEDFKIATDLNKQYLLETFLGTIADSSKTFSFKPTGNSISSTSASTNSTINNDNTTSTKQYTFNINLTEVQKEGLIKELKSLGLTNIIGG